MPPVAAAAVAVACAVLLPALRAGRARVVPAVIAFLALGVTAGGISLAAVTNGHLVSLARDEIRATVRGGVASDPITANGATSFVLRVTQVRYPEARLTDELVKVSLIGSGPSLFLGDKAEVSGRLRLPRTSKAVDYRGVLLRQGVGATMTTYPALVRRLPPPGGILSGILRFRIIAGRQIDNYMGPDDAAIARGIILGDRSNISDELNESFKRSGLAHVLAVSGLHVVLLAGVVLGMCRLVRLGSRSRQVLIVGVIAAYIVLTGNQASVLRAGVMTVLAVLVWMLGRQREMTASIAVSGLVLLAYRPLLAFDAGFQLSFGAVISLVVIMPKIEPYLSRFPEWIRTGVGAAVSAQLGVAPLLAIYFNQVSIIAPVANLAVVGPSGVGLAVGLVGCVLAPAVPGIGKLALSSAGLIFAFMVVATRFFGQARLAALTVGTPTAAKVIAYYCVLAWWLARRPPERNDARSGPSPAAGIESRDAAHRDPGRLRHARLAWVTVAALLGAVLMGMALSSFNRLGATGDRGSSLSIVFLDVGQGDATLIRTAGETVLVDAGPSPGGLARNLADEGVSRVDVVFITHDHDDHVAGLERLALSTPVGTVAVAKGVRLGGLLTRPLEMLRARGARLRRVAEGDRFEFRDGLRVAVLYPDAQLINGSESDANNNSLVLRATYGGFAALLVGDVQTEAEQEILRERLDVRADVLKIAHHGSSHGTGMNLLRAVAPQVAVISVGEGNRFGHPTRSVLRRLARAGVRAYRTDLDGDIEVTTDGKSQTVATER